MNTPDVKNSQGTPAPKAPQEAGIAATFWKQLKSKRISYLTLPLLIMATITEFVILATGWRYQQVVCLPQGMGVKFFGIGPIGATILAVELLKLPLAIWTASRHGWQKTFMMCVGLPLICLLTFQLVKDMAVYEMGVALTPASQMLEKATTEETKIAQLKGDLAAIEAKKTARDQKLAELAARKTKASADLEDSLKRIDASRQDAISLTDYQKKELANVDAREATIIQQFDADTAQINKSLADLRARRETEATHAAAWNVEEARIENDYKAKMTVYSNKKAQYDKDTAEYDNANILKRQLLKEPVSPGVPPVREANKVLKPTQIADLDDQIKAKEAELTTVNNKRRDRVAQVEAEAHQLRDEFDHRSSTKREESDRKRDALLAAQATQAAQFAAEEKQIDQDYGAVVQKVDGIRAEIDVAQKKAEDYYEAREAAIKNTQVHRIATTVEILRGLLKGQRPVSIKATAKERGDLYTDQISMVRIWVYPVLAFIVAFLPTLMVEIGFSTLFKPEQARPAYRMGFLGRRMHWLYVRAGRIKILRAERLAGKAAAEIASRERTIATVRATSEKNLAAKEAELQAAREAIDTATAQYEEQLKKMDEQFTERCKIQEAEWVSKLASMADSLNRTVVEKDALKDLQKSEIERQVQMRQNAWSDRITQLRQELDDQRSAAEAERTALMQEQHKKLMEVSESCKTQVIHARRQAGDAELAAVEASAKLTHDLKEALHARDTAEGELKRQSDAFAQKLVQAKEDSDRELEKASRQEKHRFERQQLEFTKSTRQREEDFERQLKQCQHELSLGFDTRLAAEQNRIEQEARRRETELQRQLDARAIEVDARWKQEFAQREEVAAARLKQREQQLQAQAETRFNELQAQSLLELRDRESELQRQLENQAREADGRLKAESQQKELAFQARLKQREQELAVRGEAREAELQKQFASDLRVREEEFAIQAEARVRATEARLSLESQQKDELFLTKSRQRDAQWQSKLDAARAELQVQTEEALRRRAQEADTVQRELEAALRKEMAQKDEAAVNRLKQREQELATELTAQAEARQLAAQAVWESETEKRIRAAVEPIKAQLARAEQERDSAREAAAEGERQVSSMEKKLNEASSFLNTWRNGKSMAGTT